MPAHWRPRHWPAAWRLPVSSKSTITRSKGQQCIAHCLVVFQEGDTSLAECAAKVHEMQAICDAYSYLLAANSEYTRDYARICITACEDCEMECRRHDHHIECRECAEACEKVVKLARKLLA